MRSIQWTHHHGCCCQREGYIDDIVKRLLWEARRELWRNYQQILVTTGDADRTEWRTNGQDEVDAGEVEEKGKEVDDDSYELRTTLE